MESLDSLPYIWGVTQPSRDSIPSSAPPAGPTGPAANDAPEALPYTPPTLVRFGGLRELTATVGTRGRRDGRRSRRRTGF